MDIRLNNLYFGKSKYMKSRSKCGKGKKSIPTNKRLYNSIKASVKKKAKVWPSAYASGQLVRQYKSRGGKYRCGFGSLDRWFKEKWVDVCRPKGQGYESCGRKKSSWKKYPYCRPSKRINKSTPQTVGEIGKAKIKKMCSQKRRNPRKKVFVRNKNKFGNYKIGNYKMNRFGNLARTSSNLDSFYKPGSANSINLTPGIRQCESRVYGDSIRQSRYRFGAVNPTTLARINTYRNLTKQELDEEGMYGRQRYEQLMKQGKQRGTLTQQQINDYSDVNLTPVKAIRLMNPTAQMRRETGQRFGKKRDVLISEIKYLENLKCR
jgi:hypothetical protein